MNIVTKQIEQRDHLLRADDLLKLALVPVRESLIQRLEVISKTVLVRKL